MSLLNRVLSLRYEVLENWCWEKDNTYIFKYKTKKEVLMKLLLLGKDIPALNFSSFIYKVAT